MGRHYQRSSTRSSQMALYSKGNAFIRKDMERVAIVIIMGIAIVEIENMINLMVRGPIFSVVGSDTQETS